MSPGAYALAAAVAVPLAAAALAAVKSLRRATSLVLPLSALPALLLALFGPVGTRLTPFWSPGQPVLELDAAARAFLTFTSALWLVSAWYAPAYLRRDGSRARFNVFFLLCMAGNFSLILASDIPLFYSGFALMSLASVGLVVHTGDSESIYAGKMYVTLAIVGEVAIFTGLAYLAANCGSTQISEVHRPEISPTAIVLLLVGFGIKAGALTLHFWLPLAHPAAPVPASAVLSGAMIKAGLLGWMRFLPLGETEMHGLGLVLLVAGLGAAFYAALFGVAQRNAKAVLAYSSISQMGIITTGLGIGLLRPEAWVEIQTAVWIYATHHALAKGALFLGVGPAALPQTRVKLIVGRAGLLLPALALAGAPFTSGAVAKATLKSHLNWLPDGWAAALGWLLPLAAVGTTLIMARFLWLTWPRRVNPQANDGEGLWLPWLASVGGVVAGLWVVPGVLGPMPSVFGLDQLWLASWPVLLGAGCAAVVAWLGARRSVSLPSWLPAGDIGIWLHRLLEMTLEAPRAVWRRVSPARLPPAADQRAARTMGLVNEWIGELESRLRSSTATACALLIVVAVVLGLLAWPW